MIVIKVQEGPFEYKTLLTNVCMAQHPGGHAVFLTAARMPRKIHGCCPQTGDMLLQDGFNNTVRLGGNIIANMTGGTLQSVQITGVKSNTCNTTCIGSACNALHCTDARCSLAPVSGPSG